jgi:DNA polymerase alpha subunit A
MRDRRVLPDGNRFSSADAAPHEAAYESCWKLLVRLSEMTLVPVLISRNLTLNGGRAVRNEFILLHEFHRLKYVCPDKTFQQKKTRTVIDDDNEEVTVAKTTRGKARYAGGLVFEPKRGLWDTYIMVMDFNSLYPSIIQEYNIDFTTVERDQEEDGDEEKIPDVPGGEAGQGVLPRIIATLVGRRRQVKGLMKDKSATPAKLQQVSSSISVET